MQSYGLLKKILSAHLNFGQMLKLWFISKLSISILQKQISTATKITCSYSFRMRLVSVSLQCGLPFSKSNGLASALQLPFRTGSKHPKKWVAPYTGLETKVGNITKKIFCRVLNRPSEPRGARPFGYSPFFS